MARFDWNPRRLFWRRGAVALTLAWLGSAALAHEPVARCFWMDAQTVRCRGVTNDGDRMPGARMDVMAFNGQSLRQGQLSADSTWTFPKPQQPFYVLFEIGPGLQTTVEEDEIRAPSAREQGWAWLRP